MNVWRMPKEVKNAIKFHEKSWEFNMSENKLTWIKGVYNMFFCKLKFQIVFFQIEIRWLHQAFAVFGKNILHNFCKLKKKMIDKNCFNCAFFFSFCSWFHPHSSFLKELVLSDIKYNYHIYHMLHNMSHGTYQLLLDFFSYSFILNIFMFYFRFKSINLFSQFFLNLFFSFYIFS